MNKDIKSFPKGFVAAAVTVPTAQYRVLPSLSKKPYAPPYQQKGIDLAHSLNDTNRTDNAGLHLACTSVPSIRVPTDAAVWNNDLHAAFIPPNRKIVFRIGGGKESKKVFMIANSGREDYGHVVRNPIARCKTGRFTTNRGQLPVSALASQFVRAECCLARSGLSVVPHVAY